MQASSIFTQLLNLFMYKFLKEDVSRRKSKTENK